VVIFLKITETKCVKTLDSEHYIAQHCGAMSAIAAFLSIFVFQGPDFQKILGQT